MRKKIAHYERECRKLTGDWFGRPVELEAQATFDLMVTMEEIKDVTYGLSDRDVVVTAAINENGPVMVVMRTVPATDVEYLEKIEEFYLAVKSELE